MKRLYEDAGVMSLGLVALAAFLIVGAMATFLGRDSITDEPDMPFSSTGANAESASPTAPVRTGLLPAEIRESSGIAHGRRDPSIWWTHNDGPDARVFGVLADGTLRATWRLEGVEVHDIEDIASAPCPDSPAEFCLFLADTGDNNGTRDDYAIHIVREPALGTSGAPTNGILERVAVRHFSYGGRSLDAEAMAVMPDASILVITKGQGGAAELFRLPPLNVAPSGAPARETAESLGELPVDVDRRADRITAAAISPSGSRIAVRSDRDVTIFEQPGLRELARCDFHDIGQQGEAVDFEDETTLLLTFETDSGGRAPIVRVRCGA